MKIIDYDGRKDTHLIGCCECRARMILDDNEKMPRECPICGALRTSLYNINTEKEAQTFSLVAKAFPDLYDVVFLTRAINDIAKTQKIIDHAINIYYKTNCGYAFVENEGVFVAVFQEDEQDKNCYSVVVTDFYRKIDSYGLEERLVRVKGE